MIEVQQCDLRTSLLGRMREASGRASPHIFQILAFIGAPRMTRSALPAFLIWCATLSISSCSQRASMLVSSTSPVMLSCKPVKADPQSAHLVLVPDLALNVCVWLRLQQEIHINHRSKDVIFKLGHVSRDGRGSLLPEGEVSCLLQEIYKGRDAPAILELSGVNGWNVAKVEEGLKILFVLWKFVLRHLHVCNDLVTFSPIIHTLDRTMHPWQRVHDAA
jgi:hypothetical protein